MAEKNNKTNEAKIAPKEKVTLLNIYQKLAKAREIISKTKVKKLGRNTFSKYDYFTPDQISILAEDACRVVGLLSMYSLEKTDLEYTGILTLVDVDEPDEVIIFNQSTAVPEIKATNIAQKIGGTVTYNHRYLTMIAFGISDNSLDFDDSSNSKPATKKTEPAKPTKKEPKPKKVIALVDDENYKLAVNWGVANKKKLADLSEFFVIENKVIEIALAAALA